MKEGRFISERRMVLFTDTIIKKEIYLVELKCNATLRKKFYLFHIVSHREDFLYFVQVDLRITLHKNIEMRF